MAQTTEQVKRGIRAVVPGSLRRLGSATMTFLRAEHDRLVYERPSGAYRRTVAARAKLGDFRALAEGLVRDGVVIVPEYFSGARLRAMQDEFDRLVATNPPGHGEETRAAHVSTNRIGESALLSALAFEQDFIDLAEYYWGKEVVLTATGGTRLEPFAPEGDYGSYQWHHDAKRKQLRVIILLTDVLPDGQRMDYVVGSHRAFRRDLVESRISPEAAEAGGRRLSCVGKAGTIVVFDTNGIHRGNRNLGPRRDHWQFTYRAPGGVSLQPRPPLPLHPDVIPGLTPRQRQIARLA